MSKDQLIELVPYSAAWPASFLEEAALLRSALAQWLVAAPEHIGSTAVPGMVAKPVIDIMAPVESLQASRSAIQAAAAIGYCYAPYKSDQMHWFCKPSPEHRTHHLHLVEHASPLWLERLAFRDALRGSASLAFEYQALKRALATQHANDRDAYTEGKTQFIKSILQGCSASGAPSAA